MVIKKIYKKLTILVVDDDMLSYILIQALFSKHDFELIHTMNGLDAVKICEENKGIDIVFMDIELPKMDGCKATALIKEIRPELPVVAVTAYALSTDKEKYMNCGFEAYITKPVSSEKLFETLDRFNAN